MVYKLVRKHKQDGDFSFKSLKAGRPKKRLNSTFIENVIGLRTSTEYGSEKIHHVLKKKGYGISQHVIQRILDEQGLTKPCIKRRGQRNYVRYQWPISNFMWHTDYSELNGKWYLAFIDDRSRKIMGSGVFENANTVNALFLLYHTILMNQVCPVILLSDKGTQFYNATKSKNGERNKSIFEQELEKLGIEFWTSRRNHPQTNGKMERWFHTMKIGLHRFKTLNEFVKWYNEERIHHALEYKTPEKVYGDNL